MSAWTAAGGHHLVRAPGTNDPESIEAFRAVAFDEIGIGPRLGEEIPTTPHARLVCVHLRALPFLVALFTLTAITTVIVAPAIVTVNRKSTLGRKKIQARA